MRDYSILQSDALEHIAHHPDEPTIAVTGDLVGVALPESVQAAAIMSPEAALKLGVQLIHEAEIIFAIQDQARSQVSTSRHHDA